MALGSARRLATKPIWKVSGKQKSPLGGGLCRGTATHFQDERRLYCWLDCSTALAGVGAEARITVTKGYVKAVVYAGCLCFAILLSYKLASCGPSHPSAGPDTVRLE